MIPSSCSLARIEKSPQSFLLVLDSESRLVELFYVAKQVSTGEGFRSGNQRGTEKEHMSASEGYLYTGEGEGWPWPRRLRT
jgi:hypothetical protein